MILAALISFSIFGLAHAADARLVTQESSLGRAEIKILPATVKASPDGKHLAFVARRGNTWSVVTDGVVGKEYDAIGESSLAFSPDSKRLAYAATQGNDWLVVVDGAEGKGYDGLRGIVFSPDSRRVAYVANRGRNWLAVVNGVEGRGFDGCWGVTFSPDSRRAAHVANRGRNWLVVVDGAEGKEYDEIGKHSLTFSPDSARVAYAANRGRNWLVVVDGAEGREYDALGQGNFVVPDSKREAYAALRVNPEAVALEDIIEANRPVFSPDSRCIAYWAKRGNEWLVAVNGLESKHYDGFLRGSTVVFDGAKSLHALAVLGTEAVRLKMEIVEEP
jgi:Tol biopolymer transport system component